MKNKLRFVILAVMVFAFSANIFAATDVNYSFNVLEKYKIVLDNQTYTVPSTIEYSDGNVQDITPLHETLTQFSSQSKNLDFNSNKQLSFSGVFLPSITGEYATVFSSVASKNDSINMEHLKRLFQKNYMLNYRIEKYNAANRQKMETEDKDELERLDFMISNYEEDINAFRELNISDIPQSKEFVCAVPFLARGTNATLSVDMANKKITEDMDVTYYIFSIVYRDLRLENLEYNVNSSQEYTRVPDFDMDTYTYDVTLPATTPRNAKIETKGTSNMNYVLEQNNEKYDVGISVQNATVNLVNGVGTAKVKVVLDISDFKNNDDYSSNIEREYTINFKVSDYLKGDVNKDGYINSLDAAYVLDRYTNKDATDEDIALGDMDNKGDLNATDAAAIIDLYTSNGAKQ